VNSSRQRAEALAGELGVPSVGQAMPMPANGSVEHSTN